MRQLKITSNVSGAFIFINGENSGLLPSNKYFSLPADNYSIRLSHPDYKFTPLERIIKLGPGENNMIIISGEKHSKKGKIVIADCLSSQICIDGHLTANLCGLDTLTAISGKHFITVLNQTNETLNKSEWVTFNPDSIYQICWSTDYKQWEKVNKH